MTVFQALVLGLIQGLSEFLPISSSAHLTLAPWLFHWEDPGLAFDVALHFGTLLAVLWYFRAEWIALVGAAGRIVATSAHRNSGGAPGRLPDCRHDPGRHRRARAREVRRIRVPRSASDRRRADRDGDRALGGGQVREARSCDRRHDVWRCAGDRSRADVRDHSGRVAIGLDDHGRSRDCG